MPTTNIISNTTTALLPALIVIGGLVSVSQAEDSARDLGTAPRQVVLRLPTGNSSFDRSHPLLPAMALAQNGFDHITRDIADYSCVVIRRERVQGKLGAHEYIQAKVRNRRNVAGRKIPFSVYLKFLGPASVKGREVLFVEGENDGKMIVRNGGKRFSYITTSVLPDSRLAMRDNRYPITEFGVKNLFLRLLEVAHEDVAAGVAAKVKYFENAKVEGRDCTGVHVVHTRKEDSDRFYMAKVFMDNQMNIPVHYEAYGWPRAGEEVPRLLEQYTYTRVKLNVGFSDRDFDPDNPEYQLKTRRK